MAQVLEAQPPQRVDRSNIPNIWKCGNPNCNGIVSNVDQKTIPKKYCTIQCRDEVRRKQSLSYYNKRQHIREIRRRSYQKHRVEILTKRREEYAKNKPPRRMYVTTPESRKRKLIYYLKNHEARLEYQRRYSQAKKAKEMKI